jgi:hypothetical protein
VEYIVTAVPHCALWITSLPSNERALARYLPPPAPPHILYRDFGLLAPRLIGLLDQIGSNTNTVSSTATTNINNPSTGGSGINSLSSSSIGLPSSNVSNSSTASGVGAGIGTTAFGFSSPHRDTVLHFLLSIPPVPSSHIQ